MRATRSNSEWREGTNGLVAVAIDEDKKCQNALRWAIDHLLQRGHTLILIHVKVKPFSAYPSPLPTPRLNQIPDINGDIPLVCKNPDLETRKLYLPYLCFCSRKEIRCKVVILEETDVAKALIEYVTQAEIEVLVVGASAQTGVLSLIRFKESDNIPGMVSKGAPDFCTVFVISKSEISSMRPASRPAPAMVSPLRNHLLNQFNSKPTPSKSHSLRGASDRSLLEEEVFGHAIKSSTKHLKRRSTIGQFRPENLHLEAAEHAKNLEKMENIHAECITHLNQMKSLLEKMKTVHEGQD